MIKPTLPLFLLALLGFVFAGCSSNPTITAGLKIEVVRLECGRDGAVQVAWQVQNPNIAPYLLEKAEQTITLNGVVIGTISLHAPVGVPQQATTDLTALLASSGPAGAKAVADALAVGSASYRIESKITIRIFDETRDRSTMVNAGTLKVVQI